MDKNLPAPYLVDSISEELFQTVGDRQAHNHTLRAEIAIEQGDYTTAITLAEEVLNYSERLQSRVHPKRLLRIYNLLKQSPYWHDDMVTMLEIRLVRNLYPERFSKDYEV